MNINLILTKECAKKCSFCFTGDYSTSTEMSIPLLIQILDELRPTKVSLLGGEPTQHSDFGGVVEVLNMYPNIEYLLVTNLLFSSETLKLVKGFSTLLINGMELDTKNRMRIFKKNFVKLRMASRCLAIALTISESSNPQDFENYVKYLSRELGVISQVRIGIDLSSSWIINNTVIGDIIRIIDSNLPNVHITFDCQVPPCIFSYNPYTTLHSFVNLHAICHGAPIDIFYDKSAIYCYPASSLRVTNALGYGGAIGLQKHFKEEYGKEESIRGVPKDCRECAHYLDSRCKGICLGCSEDKKVSAGIAVSNI